MTHGNMGQDRNRAKIERIANRVRMIAPTVKPPSEWKPIGFTPRGPQPDPEDEAVDDYTADRYEAQIDQTLLIRCYKFAGLTVAIT